MVEMTPKHTTRIKAVSLHSTYKVVGKKRGYVGSRDRPKGRRKGREFPHKQAGLKGGKHTFNDIL